MFKKKENGYFIDLAANHYLIGSNSFRLEQSFGWKGLCVEPNSMYLEELVHRRSCEVLVNPISDVNGEELTFRMNGVYGGVVAPDKGVVEASGSRIPKKQEDLNVVLKTVTLPTVLEKFGAPSVIDFFSLDVEGAEVLVIKGMEGFWDRYTFLTILIERPVKPLHMLLIQHGYWFLQKLNSWGDCLYVHSSIPNFDGYIKKHYPLSVAATKFAKRTHEYLLTNASVTQVT